MSLLNREGLPATLLDKGSKSETLQVMQAAAHQQSKGHETNSAVELQDPGGCYQSHGWLKKKCIWNCLPGTGMRCFLTLCSTCSSYWSVIQKCSHYVHPWNKECAFRHAVIVIRKQGTLDAPIFGVTGNMKTEVYIQLKVCPGCCHLEAILWNILLFIRCTQTITCFIMHITGVLLRVPYASEACLQMAAGLQERRNRNSGWKCWLLVTYGGCYYWRWCHLIYRWQWDIDDHRRECPDKTETWCTTWR